MPRGFLSAGERERLSTYPADISDWDLGRFFTLTARDLELVELQRGDDNRLGFALQLCTLRYLGFIPQDLLEPPPTIVRLLAHQLDVAAEALNSYGQREQTRTDHLGQVMDYLGYRRASAEDLATLENWLDQRFPGDSADPGQPSQKPVSQRLAGVRPADQDAARPGLV